MEQQEGGKSVSDSEEEKIASVDLKEKDDASNKLEVIDVHKRKSDQIDNHQDANAAKKVHMTFAQMRELRQAHAVEGDVIKSIIDLTTKQEE